MCTYKSRLYFYSDVWVSQSYFYNSFIFYSWEGLLLNIKANNNPKRALKIIVNAEPFNSSKGE